MLELTVRLVFSLAVVIGLLLLIARFSARRFRSAGGATIQVIHRQALTRSSAVSVVSVGGRVLVLGSTEQQINLLAELDPDELDLAELDPAELEGGDSTPEGGAESPDLEPVGLTILESPRTVAVPEPSRLTARSSMVEPTPAPSRRGAHRAPGARKAARKSPTAAGVRRTPDQSGTWKRQVSGEATGQRGALAGSILSPDTWRQAIAATRRAS